MPVFKDVQTVATSGVVTNIMAGSKFEFLPRNSVIRIYASQDGTTRNVDLDFTLGNVVVGDSLAPNRSAAVGVGPDRNTDLLATGVGAAGDRIQIRAQETTGVAGGQPIRVLVEINEL